MTTKQLRKFAIASQYIERGVDSLTGRLYEAISPFEALVANCMELCEIEDWEACKLFGEESWDAIVFEHDLASVQLVSGPALGLPWVTLAVLRTKIETLEHAIESAADMDILSTIPGTNYQGLDLEPARDILDGMRAEFVRVTDMWERRQNPEVSFETRQKRSVQVDVPEEGIGENDIPF